MSGQRGAVGGDDVLRPSACHCRLCGSAPTEVIHGTSAGEPTVAAPGPSLPAEVAT